VKYINFVISFTISYKMFCQEKEIIRNFFNFISLYNASFVVYYYYYSVTVTACMMDFTTETVMQLCHGKRRCTVVANSTTFGRPDPCSPDSKTYLKVVYTCGE